MKKRINISLDEETAEMIKIIADISHKSVSQWISDSVWECSKENNINIEDYRGNDNENSI